MKNGRSTKELKSREAKAARRSAVSESGAVDLSSVAVGAAVIGIMAATTMAIVFGAVPWSQDRTAKQDLSAITVAQASAELKSNKFMSAADLADQGLLDKKNGSLVRVFDVKDAAGTKTGECYVGVSVSGTGDTFYVTDSKTSPAKLPADASGVGCGSAALVQKMITEVNYKLAGSPSIIPAAPVLSLTYSSGAKVGLNWSAPTDATAARRADFHAVEYRIGTGPWTVLDNKVVDTKAVVTGEFGKRVSVRVQAGNAAGLSGYSVERGVNILALPAKPVIGAAAATGPTSAGFSWDDVPAAAGYTVEYSVNQGPWQTRSTDQTATNLSVGGLVKGDRVKARVRALNPAGASAFTESAEVSVTGAIGTPVVSGAKVSATKAEFTWESVGTDNYRVESRIGTGAWTVISESQSSTKVAVTGRAGEKIGVRVRVAGSTAYSAIATVALPVTPPAPTDVVGTLTDGTNAVFTWPAVTTATGYIVERWTAAGWEIMPEQTGTTFTSETSKAVGGKVTIRVLSVGEAGTSAAGASSTVTLPTAPAAPVLTAVLQDNSNVTFSWKDVPGASSYTAQSRIGNGTWTDIDLPAEDLSTTVSGDPGQKIEVRATATNSIGTSAYSAVASKTLPDVPGMPNARVTAVSGTDALATWPAVSGAESYVVSWSAAGDRWIEMTTTENEALISTGTVPGIALDVKVYAANSVGRSAEPDEIKTTLPVIADVPVATASEITGTGVKVTWKAVPGATGYRVESGRETWEEFGGVVTGTTVTIPAEPGEKVSVRVRSENLAGTSDPSDVVSVQMLALPESPVVKAELTAATSTRFIWEEVGTATRGYNVQKSVNGGAWSTIGTGTKDLATILTGAAGQNLSLRVQSVNAAGTSDWSETMTMRLPKVAAAPVVTGSPSSSSTATFSWNTPDEAETFRVEYRIGTEAWELQSAGQMGSETTVMAPAGSVVEVRVQARNLAGDSGYGTAVVTMPDLPVPGSQSPVSVTLSTGNQTFSWDDVEDASQYRIRYTTDGSEPSAVNGTQIVQSGLSYQLTQPKGTVVKFRVQPGNAQDVWGTSFTLTATAS